MGALDKKVVIIGTGIGGAGCGAILSHEGLPVTILERNRFPGGKAASFTREGYTYDTGVHCIGSGEKGPLGEIDRRVGGDLDFNLVEEGMWFLMGENRAHFPLELASEDIAADIVRDIGVGEGERDNCTECFMDLGTERSLEELEELDGLPLKDYVDRYTDDPVFHMMINTMTGMLMMLTYFEASTGEFIYCFSELAENASLSYPVGGMVAVPMAYLKALGMSGGEARFGLPVERILVDGDRVVGVEAGETIPADIVVSNAGLQPTVKLVGEEHFSDDYISWARSLRSSFGAVSVKYALEAEVLDNPVMLYIADIRDPEMLTKYTSVFLPVPSLMDPSLAPEGCQLALAGSGTTPLLKYRDKNEEMIDRIEATVKLLHPEIAEHLVWKMRTNVDYVAAISGREFGEVIGLSQSYTQVGKNRPDPRMPIEGLYLVGADAGGRGIGTEMAANSALNVSSMIMEDIAAGVD